MPHDATKSAETSLHPDEIAQISDAFLEKYNRPGPRYTSYPNRARLERRFRPRRPREILRARRRARHSSLALHAHSFLRKPLPVLRLYCFDSKRQKVAVPYLDALKREIDHVATKVSNKRPVIQFHWGGGTPTYLSVAQMEDLFQYTHDRFSFAPDAEIGIEIDPRVTSRAQLESLRRLGFNRLSMGIQDFQPKVQETIHRVQPYEMTRDLILAAREIGFQSINIDLIYGLPYQTAESFRATIDQALTLRPDRVAMFSYAHVPWLKKQQGSFEAHLPEGMEKFRIFRAGLEQFLSADICISAWTISRAPATSLPSRSKTARCTGIFRATPRKRAPICTAWASARLARSVKPTRRIAVKFPLYESAVGTRGIATMRGYRLSADDVFRRAVIGRLLCHTMIPKHEVEAEFGISFDEYFAAECSAWKPPREEGLVVLSPDEIRVTPLGRIFIRNVAMTFDRYLHEQQMDQRPLFSKTL